MDRFPEERKLYDFGWSVGKGEYILTRWNLASNTATGPVFVSIEHKGKQWIANREGDFDMDTVVRDAGTPNRYPSLKTAMRAEESAFQAYRENSCQKHTWKLSQTFAKEISEYCPKCSAQRTRPSTKKESLKFVQNFKHMWEDARKLHRVYHRFVALYGNQMAGWKFKGYELMCRVEKWAKHYPNDVRISSIDDSHFCGSILVFIDHKSADAWHGVSVIVIPQCTGESPVEFFMYPESVKDAQKVLSIMARQAKELKEI
jgi:hypothetical protein